MRPILWGNTVDQIYDPEENSSVTYSNFQGSGATGALGNIDWDPEFANALTANLQLTCDDPPSTCSPSIDMGNDASAPVTNIVGNHRVNVPTVGSFDTLADMGAYEFQLPL